MYAGPSGNDESSQRERLRDDLRRQFPAKAGYEVSEGRGFDIVDSKSELMRVMIVTSNGVDLTFFPRMPKNWPGRAPRIGQGLPSRGESDT